MIKSAMREALKQGLMSRKSEGRMHRAKAYVKEPADEENKYPGAQQRDEGDYDEDLIQGSEKGLRDKVRDAEDDAMADLESFHPSEYEGSAYEEMSESEQEAEEEGDPEEYRDPDYWRGEQVDFMKNRSTSKPPKKSGSFFMAVGVKPSKAHRPGNPRSGKGAAQQSF